MHKLKVEEWELDRVKVYENDPKLHPDWQVEQIADSMEEFGMLDPVAVDENGELLEGRGRLLAAQKRNDSTIPVIQILGLTEAQKVAYRLAHNQLTMNTGFDLDLLQLNIDFLKEEEFDIDLTGFSDEDLDFGSGDGGGKGEGKKKELKDPEIPEVVESRVKPGEIWKLGRHYIACGDCTVESNIKELLEFVDGRSPDMVWADPPFNTKQQQGRTSSEWGIIANDDLSDSDFKDFIEKVFKVIIDLCPNNFYICCHWRSYPLFYSLLPSVSALIIWVKNNFGLGSGYRPKHELIIFKGEIESNSESNVWEINKDSSSGSSDYKHPMQKPAALVEKAISNSTSFNSIIFDPFLGSAPSIIAAEQMEGDRAVIGFELSDHYCEIICRRFEQISDEVPRLVGRLGNTPTPEQLAELGF